MYQEEQSGSIRGESIRSAFCSAIPRYMKRQLTIRARANQSCLWESSNYETEQEVQTTELRLSPRLVTAIIDWQDFYDEEAANLKEDEEAMAEFIGQGYKLAHALRRELKGYSITFVHPLTNESIPIKNNRPS